MKNVAKLWKILKKNEATSLFLSDFFDMKAVDIKFKFI